MLVDIYKVKKRKKYNVTEFLIIKSCSGREPIVPKDVLPQTSDYKFLRTLDLNICDRRINLDSKKALLNINKVGFHVQEIKI